MRSRILTAVFVLTAISPALAQDFFNSPPALVSSRPPFYADVSGEMKDRSLGFVAKADIKIGDATGPDKFWHALISYEHAGRLQTGAAPLPLIANYPRPTVHTVTWQPASINYSHWSIAIGYGMRLP